MADLEVSRQAVDVAVSKFGGIQLVVANAGVLDPVDPVANADISAWKTLFDINLFGVVALVQAALPYLAKSHGRFIAVSSGASTKPYYGWSAYGASKAALNHFVLSVAAENAGVQSLSVAPGVVATAMQQDIREKFGKNMTPESLQRFIDLHENGQLLPPELPAGVLVNLALRGWSDELNGGYVRVGEASMKQYEN